MLQQRHAIHVTLPRNKQACSIRYIIPPERIQVLLPWSSSLLYFFGRSSSSSSSLPSWANSPVIQHLSGQQALSPYSGAEWRSPAGAVSCRMAIPTLKRTPPVPGWCTMYCCRCNRLYRCKVQVVTGLTDTAVWRITTIAGRDT